MDATFLYRLSCVHTNIEELDLPFGDVIERALMIAFTTWKVDYARSSGLMTFVQLLIALP